MDSQGASRSSYQLKEARSQLPGIVQTVARDLSMKLEWAPYLSAAPAAICVMATCLVAGSSEDASIIEVNVPKRRTPDELLVKPSRYLGTHLHECTQVGKEAFKEAHNRMMRLNARAESVVQDGGTLARILDVLQDSDPSIAILDRGTRELQEVASICQDEARTMKEKFATLLGSIVELRGAVVEAKNENTKQSRDKEDLSKHSRQPDHQLELKEVELQTKNLEADLDRAREDVKTSQEEVAIIIRGNGCQSIQTDIDEINAELRKIERDEHERVNRPIMKRIFKAASELLFGAEQHAKKIQEERKQSLYKRLESLLIQRTNLISLEQESALKKVEAQQERVADIEQKLNRSKEKYMTLLHEQFQATQILCNAHEDLQELANRSLDLKIHDILSRSIRALRELNKYIDQMTFFFTEVSSYVDDVIKVRLDQFKQQTEEDMAAESSRTYEENARHRMNAIHNLLELHARFALISDIARIYGTVSKTYIFPGIMRMDGLTDIDEDEYDYELEGFKKWSSNAVKGIEELAKFENEKIEAALLLKMVSLAKRQLADHSYSMPKESIDEITWISSAGTSVMKDAKSSFEIFVEESGETVRPTDPNSKEGAVHFSLPSPQVNKTLTEITVDFYPRNVCIQKVVLSFANEEVFSKAQLQRISSFKLACGEIPYQGKGITVTIHLEFDQVGSAITFQSVAIGVA
ncbi:hypothetical protein BDV25DRAFT_136107 [Aspergillus avenaceus]|uniref:Uncharacterized protein n=1 Tax=Aspergillus avenaceus TaxID=36643 RepID=A0A5N6U7U4_ASPAV|nr:hypothetical protein BDV25DRAFT_136107 [Aspergillus avenaceus]